MFLYKDYCHSDLEQVSLRIQGQTEFFSEDVTGAEVASATEITVYTVQTPAGYTYEPIEMECHEGVWPPYLPWVSIPVVIALSLSTLSIFIMAAVFKWIRGIA